MKGARTSGFDHCIAETRILILKHLFERLGCGQGEVEFANELAKRVLYGGNQNNARVQWVKERTLGNFLMCEVFQIVGGFQSEKG